MRHEAVALQQFAVVLANLCGDARIVYAGIGGKQLGTVTLVRQVVAYIACHVDLVVQFLDGGIGLAGLRHVHTGGGLYIGQQMLALVGGDVIVHVTQFALDHTEAAVNELRGTNGYLVLVPHPVLVIDSYQGVQHVFRPLGGNILE